MALKPESKFRKRVQRDLDSLPVSVFDSIQQKSIRGTPDIIGHIGGLYVALELKSEKGKPSPLQEHKIKKIVDTGGIGVVVYPYEWPGIFSQLKNLANCRCKEIYAEKTT